MSTVRKRSNTDEPVSNRKRRLSMKEVNIFIPLNISVENTNVNTEVEEPALYTQSEVTALLAKQEQDFRRILEEKLSEQFNLFNQLYIDNIFREYNHIDCSYIN